MRTALSWLQTILLDVVGPVVVYYLLTGNGVGDVPALVISGAVPAVSLVITAVLERRVDEIGLIVLILLAVSVVAALLFNDPRVLLIKDSAVTGLFGLVFLASLLAPRPLTFFFGRKFATGGNPARVAWWNGLWQFAAFRHVQRVLAVVWGVGLLAEAALRVVLALLLPVPVMVVINSVLPLAVTALLVTGTIVYGRRARAAAGDNVPAEPTAAPAT